MCCLHGTRIRLLLLNYDIDKDHNYFKKVHSVSPLVSMSEFKKQSSLIRTLADSQYGGSAQNPFEAVKSKNLITRRLVCKEQIVHWSQILRHTEAMMLVQAEDESVTPVLRQAASWIPPAILIPAVLKNSSGISSNYHESTSPKGQGPSLSYPGELSDIPDDASSTGARTGIETISIERLLTQLRAQTHPHLTFKFHLHPIMHTDFFLRIPEQVLLWRYSSHLSTNYLFIYLLNYLKSSMYKNSAVHTFYFPLDFCLFTPRHVFMFL